MASSVSGRFTTYRVMRPFGFNDFSGGWNIRDAPSELADNESPDMLNMTLTERGGIVKRLGYSQVGGGTGLSGSPSNMFYWKTLDTFIIQDGAEIKRTGNFTSYITLHTFTTDAVASFADFDGLLVIVHPDDKVSVYDGTTWEPISESPRGSCIAVWQNKVWVSGDPSAKSRVYACNAGNPRVWTLAEDYNDMREKNHAPVTALGVGQGMDVSGRPGLLVFKKNWNGRINTAASGTEFGQYTTLHNEAGACGPLAVTSTLSGVVCSINERGIWAGDGVNTPTLVSGKIDPLFESTQLNLSACEGWCAERDGNRVIFSISRSGSTVNNMMLEYNPDSGWIVPHGVGFSCMGLFSRNAHQLYVGSSTEGKIFRLFEGWSDDGDDIAAHFQTKWFEPQGGYSIRLRRMRVRGRGSFDVYTKHDYNDTLDTGQPFDSTLALALWGIPNWGEFTWGQQPVEAYDDMYSWGVAKSFAVVVQEESQTSAFGPTLIGGTTAQEIGSFALYGVLLDYVRLGYA